MSRHNSQKSKKEDTKTHFNAFDMLASSSSESEHEVDIENESDTNASVNTDNSNDDVEQDEDSEEKPQKKTNRYAPLTKEDIASAKERNARKNRKNKKSKKEKRTRRGGKELSEDDEKQGNSDETETKTETKTKTKTKDKLTITSRYVAPTTEGEWISKKKRKYKPKGVKQVYDPETLSEEKNEEIGNNALFNSKWYVYFHHNDNPSWKIEDYRKISSYRSIGEFWRIFNNFHFLNKVENQVYVMREGIMPIWEDINNRGGGIYSLKIEFADKHKRNEIGSELMTAICLMISNESFVRKNKCINGVNYAIKHRSIMIKLWVRNYDENLNFKVQVPVDFLNVVDNVLKRNDTYRRSSRNHDSSKVSTRWGPIKPED